MHSPDAPKTRSLDDIIATLHAEHQKAEELRKQLADPASFDNSYVWRILQANPDEEPAWHHYRAQIIPEHQADLGSRRSAVFELLEDMAPTFVKGDRIRCERESIGGSPSWTPVGREVD
jgi:hypothetical protein